MSLTSYLTGLDRSVLQIKTKIISSHTADSKPVKQEVNSTVIPPPLVFRGLSLQMGQHAFSILIQCRGRHWKGIQSWHTGYVALSETTGEGKTTAIVSANVNGLSATFPFSVLPSGGGGAETESTLTLAENVNVVLPTAVRQPPITCHFLQNLNCLISSICPSILIIFRILFCLPFQCCPL